MDLLGFTPSDTTKFTPTSITNFAISQGKAMLNNISQFFVNIDCVNSSYNNSQASTTLIYTTTIKVSPYSTQGLTPFNLRWCDIFKNPIDSLTVTLTSETGNLIDMTGGNGGTPELFAVTFIIREKK